MTDTTIKTLDTLDEQIRTSTGGEPGSGLYNLLSQLAAQTLGIPRSAFVAKVPEPPPAEAEPEPDPPARHGRHQRL
jgi:hypothetical protein